MNRIGVGIRANLNQRCQGTFSSALRIVSTGSNRLQQLPDGARPIALVRDGSSATAAKPTISTSFSQRRFRYEDISSDSYGVSVFYIHSACRTEIFILSTVIFCRTSWKEMSLEVSLHHCAAIDRLDLRFSLRPGAGCPRVLVAIFILTVFCTLFCISRTILYSTHSAQN